jgi:hypothetical protein
MGGRLFSQRARRPFVPGACRDPPTNIVHSLDRRSKEATGRLAALTAVMHFRTRDP